MDVQPHPAGKETIAVPTPNRPSAQFNRTPSGNARVVASALGEKSGGGYLDPVHFGDVKGTDWHLDEPYGSPAIYEHLP